MSKSDLASAVALSTGLTKAASADAIDAVFAAITEQLAAEGLVRILGFGTFSVVKRPARNGLNPKTKAPVKIKATSNARFRVGTKLKRAINKG